MIHHGDCVEVMAAMDPDSIDAIVTDPPYGLEFMGKGWDHGVPGVPFWTEVLRVAKPGAHLVAFGGTRTHHRLMCAIEDAGWEIRDCLMWLYGSGFPKSLDVGKAIDKAAGVGRVDLGPSPNWREAKRDNGQSMNPVPNEARITAPATDAAKQWDGWGTALKPAWEPIVLARKPLTDTVAQNVQQCGTGALNVDGCRVAHTDEGDLAASQAKNPGRTDRVTSSVYGTDRPQQSVNTSGRWPANVVLDEEAARTVDEQTGDLPTGTAVRRNVGHSSRHGASFGVGGSRDGDMREDVTFGDNGGASRFFYCAKASRAEREAGLEGVVVRTKAASGGAQGAESSGVEYEAAQGIGLNRIQRTTNHHPTVKPVALMRWLVRLVTPPKGTVLDPFMGSGSTGVACGLEGFHFIGLELEAEYIPLARARIRHATRQPGLWDTV